LGRSRRLALQRPGDLPARTRRINADFHPVRNRTARRLAAPQNLRARESLRSIGEAFGTGQLLATC
jgi:hypothetical protein